MQLRRTGAPKSETPKQQARENIGITRQQADRFVKLAENKDIVEQAKAEARENDVLVVDALCRLRRYWHPTG